MRPHHGRRAALLLLLCASLAAPGPAVARASRPLPASDEPAWPETMRVAAFTNISNVTLGRLDFLVWSNEAAAEGALLRTLLAEAGSTEVTVTPWRVTQGALSGKKQGVERELTFTAKVSAGMQSTARCHVVQHKHYYRRTVTVRSRQVMLNIPFGKTFSVDMLWVMKSLGGRRVSVKVGVEVVFSSHTTFSGQIESVSHSESAKMAGEWMGAIQGLVSGRPIVAHRPPAPPEMQLAAFG